MEASGVFDLGHAFGPESRPLSRAGSRPVTVPGTPGHASHGGTMHLSSLRAIIGQPANMQHLPERPTSALSNTSLQRPKTSRGKPSQGLSRPQTAGTLSSSPLFSNREYGTKQISDLARKTQQETAALKRYKSSFVSSNEQKGQLSNLGAAGSKIAREEDMGLLAAKVKDKVFNLNGGESMDQEMKS